MRPHGDWIAVNGNRPAFSELQMSFTGFTLDSHRSMGQNDRVAADYVQRTGSSAASRNRRR